MKKKILLPILILLLSLVLFACEKGNKKDKYPNDVYYNLFVRSFADSNNDGIGDLKGVTENLDYFEDLGVTGLWLLPIFESPSYHGYDTINYLKIQEEYGTMEDLEELVNEGKKRNIKVILDLVINHTSDQHPWYVSASTGVDSEYRDFYTWTTEDNAYQAFVGGMVDLNLKNEKVKQEIFKITDFYLDMGIAGFRLDAVKHFFEEHSISNLHIDNLLFMAELRRKVTEKNPKAFLVGEVLDTDYNFLTTYQKSQTSYFNFYVRSELISKAGSNSISSASLLAGNLEKMYDSYRNENPNFLDSPIIGNHDLDRLASEVPNEDKQKLLANILMTLPGSPFIYYGDEIGLKGKRYEGATIDGKVVYDEYRRQPLLWGDSRTTTWLASDGSNNNTKSVINQMSDEKSIYNSYKNIIEVRKNTPALMYGNEFYKYEYDKTIAYLRVLEDENYKEAVLVLHNSTLETINVDLDLKIIYGQKELKPNQTLILKVPFKNVEDYK